MDQAGDGQQFEKLRQNVFHIFRGQLFVEVEQRAPPLEVEAETTARREVDEGSRLRALIALGAREDDAAPLEVLLLVQGPGRDEVLGRQLTECLLIR